MERTDEAVIILMTMKPMHSRREMDVCNHLSNQYQRTIKGSWGGALLDNGICITQDSTGKGKPRVEEERAQNQCFMGMTYLSHAG